MSRVAFLFILIIAVGLSCTRDKMDAAHVNSKVLPGVWEIRYAAGGEPAHIETHYAAGNGNLLVFTNDSSYSIIDSAVYNLGAYHVDNKGINPFTKQPVSRLSFTNSQPSSFEIKNDTLTFYPDENMAAWGYVSQYVKIAETTTRPLQP